MASPYKKDVSAQSPALAWLALLGFILFKCPNPLANKVQKRSRIDYAITQIQRRSSFRQYAREGPFTQMLPLDTRHAEETQILRSKEWC